MSNDKYEEVVLDVDSNDLIYSVEDTEAETEEGRDVRCCYGLLEAKHS